MNWLLSTLGIILAILIVSIPLYLLSARRYQSSDSVANSYDEWTDDGILEYYWGEHIHLGHYGFPTHKQGFFNSQIRFCS